MHTRQNQSWSSFGGTRMPTHTLTQDKSKSLISTNTIAINSLPITSNNSISIIRRHSPMIPIITAIASNHWCSIVNSTACGTNPNLILFICLHLREREKSIMQFTIPFDSIEMSFNKFLILFQYKKSKITQSIEISFTCSSTVCMTFWTLCGSMIAVELSKACDFLSESLTTNDVLAFDDFVLFFKLLEPFGRPRPDGVGGNGVVVAIVEW